MPVFKNLKVLLCFSLCFCLFSTSTFAQSQPKLINTMEMMNHFDRTEAQAEVKDYINQDEIKQMFAERGFTAEEMNLKLASLSDAEIKDLKLNVEQAKAGGVLVAILLVILIIYFAQRI